MSCPDTPVATITIDNGTVETTLPAPIRGNGYNWDLNNVIHRSRGGDATVYTLGPLKGTFPMEWVGINHDDRAVFRTAFRSNRGKRVEYTDRWGDAVWCVVRAYDEADEGNQTNTWQISAILEEE